MKTIRVKLDPFRTGKSAKGRVNLRMLDATTDAGRPPRGLPLGGIREEAPPSFFSTPPPDFGLPPRGKIREKTNALRRTQLIRLSNQALCGNIQAMMQLPDHLQGQRALMVKDFVNPV